MSLSQGRMTSSDSVVKNPPANAGDKRDAGSIPGSGRCPGAGNGYPLQCSCRGNPMDRGAWWECSLQGCTESDTPEWLTLINVKLFCLPGLSKLSKQYLKLKCLRGTFQLDTLSGVFQWTTQSAFSIALKFVGRRQWHPTPGLLPGKSHGWRSLVGLSPWGREESDTTEWLHFHFSLSRSGEGNGNPLQCSCLRTPRDRGAWWAAIYGVTQSEVT